MNGFSAPPGKWRLLAVAQAANSPFVNFSNYLSSAFDWYILQVLDYVPATDNTLLWLRVTEDGITWKSGAADYGHGNHTIGNGTTLFGSGSTADSKIVFGPRSAAGEDFSNTAAKAMCGMIEIWKPADTNSHKRFFGRLMFEPPSGGTQMVLGHGHYIGSINPIVGIQLLSSSGNIASGDFRLYGVSA